MHRIRLYYWKTQPLRYTSNLDIHKIWERTLRRARLPLAYSKGYHPQPRMNQACPLPLGFLSYSEIIDVWLEEFIENSVIMEKLELSLPPGIENIKIDVVEINSPSPQNLVKTASYETSIITEYPEIDIHQKIMLILQLERIQRTRRGKQYNLRPLIIHLEAPVQSKNNPIIINMVLTAQQGATGRPDEVLAALGFDPFASRITRTSLELINI